MADEFTRMLEEKIAALQPKRPVSPEPQAAPDYSDYQPAFIIRTPGHELLPLQPYNDTCSVLLASPDWFAREAGLRQLPDAVTVQAELPPLDWACASLKWYEELGDDERWLIIYYMGRGFSSMNRALWSGRKTDECLELNSVFNTTPALTRSMVAYRYTPYDYKLGRSILQGYTSCSYDAYQVFTAGFDRERPYNILRLSLPAGLKAIYTISHEREIILPAALAMTVNKIEQQQGRKIYHCTISL